MEIVRGQSLKCMLRKHGPLSAETAVDVGIHLCCALGAVHEHDLVHGDLKAENVLREDGGRIVLADFGAARDRHRDTLAGVVSGTPSYLAPEVLSGSSATPQSDIYALGVLLFHLLTARFPCVGDSFETLLAAQVRGEHLPLAQARPDLSARLVSAIERALAPEHHRRYADVGEFAATLEAAVTPRPRRWRWFVMGCIVIALAALAAHIFVPVP